jgi:hypothetical protein
MKDWKIFKGDGSQHDDLTTLPKPPPWRFSRPPKTIAPFAGDDPAEERRAQAFLPAPNMVSAVNAALSC